MNFVTGLTVERGCQLSNEALERLRNKFNEHLGKDKNAIDFDDFKKVVPAKNEFFVRQIFNIFDYDKSGTITLSEFIQTVKHFSEDDDDAKIQFLFQVYDTDSDGVLQEDNFREVLKACMTENGMKFEEEDLDNLAHLLFTDGCKEGANHMTLDDFKEQLYRQEGLVKNMGIMITKWLVPPRAPKESNPMKDKLSKVIPMEIFTKAYLTNNKRLWVALIFLINIIIMAQRVFYFRDLSMNSGYVPNWFYLISRACGKALLFNGTLILVLVLRKAITALTRFGFAKILPLDNNIYLHKVVGIIIFVQAMLHTFCHLLNFGINIQPNPLRFLQLSWDYWTAHFGNEDLKIGTRVYHFPEGCKAITEKEHMDNSSDYKCLDDSFPSAEDMNIYSRKGEWLCQGCNSTGRPWTFAEWIFTSKPHIFGLEAGAANPTGLALIIILSIMFVCSLPFIRRRGHFEIFYFTHMLYWVFFALLINHAPDYWKWIIAPGFIWLIEKVYRIIKASFGAGKTHIKAGIILPSNVTNLIIQRPLNFHFTAGEWMFIKIPAIASSEWHPFTISSAPEVKDTLTLHIRGVGQWTNSLHAFFKAEVKRQKSGKGRTSAIEDPIAKVRGTVKRLNSVMEKKNAVPDEENFLKRLGQQGLEERQKERMEKRASKLEMNDVVQAIGPKNAPENLTRYPTIRGAQIVKYNTETSLDNNLTSVVVQDPLNQSGAKGVQRKLTSSMSSRMGEPLVCYIDGPFGSPASNVYQAEHAVLVGAGIGITPFASILQSIMHRYLEIKQTCSNCGFHNVQNLSDSMFKLNKVDFFWINRDQKSFEWFVNLLSQLEKEQQEHGGELNRFLDMHMYVTSALQRTDMKAVALQLALDILYKKEDRDLVTGLKSRTNAGRPNWNKVFTKLREEKKGKVTVFYCGPPALANILKTKCEEFGFKFRKETF